MSTKFWCVNLKLLSHRLSNYAAIFGAQCTGTTGKKKENDRKTILQKVSMKGIIWKKKNDFSKERSVSS